MVTWCEIPILPVKHPSSGNLQGVALPANLIQNADVHAILSNDPSALGSVYVGGAATAGDVLKLTFRWGATSADVSYTVKATDTPTSMAAGLSAAIATKIVSGGSLYGQVFYTATIGNGCFFDYDCRVPMTLAGTVSGAMTETLVLPAAHPVPLPIAWDNNPSFEMSRFVEGVAPPPNSVIGVWQIGSTESAKLQSVQTLYGEAGIQVQCSISGQLLSRWFFTLPDNNGNMTRGTFIGYEGVYPVTDNVFWSGHQNMRWSHVWAYNGNFKFGLTVSDKPGLNASISYVKPGGSTGVMTFTGGILTDIT